MTDVEIVQDAVSTLGSLNVPVELIKSIGVPIYRVHGNLSILLKAIMASQKNEEKETAEETSSEEN